MKINSKWYYVYYNGEKITDINKITDKTSGELKIVEKHYLETKSNIFILFFNGIDWLTSGRDYGAVRANNKNRRYLKKKTYISVFYLEYKNIDIFKFRIKPLWEKVNKYRIEKRDKLNIRGVESFTVIKREEKDVNEFREERLNVRKRNAIRQLIILLIILIGLYIWAISTL